MRSVSSNLFCLKKFYRTAIIAFEIKMSEHVQKTDARHLKDLEDILDKPLLHAFVLSNDVITSKISDKISMLNAAMFLG